MMNADPGFNPRSAITMSVELPTVRYDTAAAAAFYERATARVAALPGVRAMARAPLY
jgi:hypothetical protein